MQRYVIGSGAQAAGNNKCIGTFQSAGKGEIQFVCVIANAQFHDRVNGFRGQFCAQKLHIGIAAAAFEQFSSGTNYSDRHNILHNTMMFSI